MYETCTLANSKAKLKNEAMEAKSGLGQDPTRKEHGPQGSRQLGSARQTGLLHNSIQSMSSGHISNTNRTVSQTDKKDCHIEWKIKRTETYKYQYKSTTALETTRNLVSSFPSE